MHCLQNLTPRSHRFLAIVLVVGSALLPASAEAAGTPPAAADTSGRATALEKAGDLSAALTLLNGARLTRAQARQRAVLRTAVQSIGAARIYQGRHQLALAESVLTALSARVDPVRDVYVRAAVQNELTSVKAALAPRPKAQPGFFADLWSSVRSTARTALEWLIVLAAAMLVVAALWWIRRGVLRRLAPRKGIGVALQDLSIDSATSSNRDRVLGQELKLAIAAASQTSTDGPRAELDVAKDLDGGGAVNVRVAGTELAALDPYLDKGAPVKVGPLAISPRQLLDFVNGLFQRPFEYQVQGSFGTSGTTSRFSVELRERNAPPVTWTSSHDGSDSRATVILEVARRILFRAARTPISTSWASVAAYQDARSKLAATTGLGDRSETLENARELLERSLNRDPANALARFELGGVLRKLGRNAEAVSQYDFLRELPPDEDPRRATEMRRGIDYSCAVALSKIDRWEEHKRALSLLEALRTELQADQGLAAPEREALLLQVRSAWSAAKVFEAERIRHSDDVQTARKRLAEVMNDVAEVQEWVTNSHARVPDRDLNTFVQARAVAENALGRVVYLSGDPTRRAIAAFELALSLVPEFGDAHVNLASALLRARERLRDWFERADGEITRALQISPRDAKALYLRGDLYLRVGRDKDARIALETAEELGDDWATMRLAEEDWKAGARVQALERAKRAIARGPEYDYRARLLVTWVGQLARADGPDGVDRATLEAGQRAGRTLVHKAEKRKTRVSAAVNAALEQIDARLILMEPNLPDEPEAAEDGVVAPLA
jgi:tetratricopeptide (TPR) repeat protein